MSMKDIIRNASNGTKIKRTSRRKAFTPAGECQQATIVERPEHVIARILFPQEAGEASKRRREGDNGNCTISVVSNGCRIDNITRGHRTKHGEDGVLLGSRPNQVLVIANGQFIWRDFCGVYERNAVLETCSGIQRAKESTLDVMLSTENTYASVDESNIVANP